MKLISVSSLLYYVTDLQATKEFYEAIGFQFNNPDKMITYLNWFSIEFRQADEPLDTKGCGEYVYIKVDKLEDMLARLQGKSIKAASDIKDVGGGVRELQVQDPDGYQLTFFDKK